MDKTLKEVLELKGYDKCPECDRLVDRGELAWNSAATEGGTPYSVIQCQCQACDTEIFSINSWWGLEYGLEDAIYALEKN